MITEILGKFLLFLYLISAFYLLLFLVGLKSSRKDNMHYSLIGRRLSVILPIYREDTKIIKNCLNSLIKQNVSKLDLVIVVKDTGAEQINFIKTYAKKFNSFKVLVQKGKQSEIDAYKMALKQIKTDYTCMLNVDIVILKNSINNLFSSILNENGDLGFGLLYPEINTKFAKYTAIDKLFRQLLLQKGRGALGMGYYITGPFYIIKTKLLRKHLTESLAYDFEVALKLYSEKDKKFVYVGRPFATELEKNSFLRWVVQYSRWALGEISMFPTYKQFFLNAESKVRLGFFGVLWEWHIMPLSFLGGILFIILTHGSLVWFSEGLILYYAVITGVIFTLPKASEYGKSYLISFWFVSLIAKSLGILLTPYTYFIRTYRRDKAYKLYTR